VSSNERDASIAQQQQPQHLGVRRVAGSALLADLRRGRSVGRRLIGSLFAIIAQRTTIIVAIWARSRARGPAGRLLCGTR